MGTLPLEGVTRVPKNVEVDDYHIVHVATYTPIVVPLMAHQAHTEVVDISLVAEVVHSCRCIHQVDRLL